MKKILFVLLAVIGVGGGIEIAFRAGLKVGENKARYFRSALQDYTYITGEARTLVTKYLTGDLEGKAESWVGRSAAMDRKYSVLIGQTPRDDGSRPTLDEVIAAHEDDRSMYQGILAEGDDGGHGEVSDTI